MPERPKRKPRSPQLLTSHEAAAVLGVSKTRVYQLAQDRGVGQVKAGVMLFSRAEVEYMRPRKPGRPGHR